IGLLYLVAGGWLAFFPFTGIITLTILLAALFLAAGVLEVIMAVRVRPHEGWVWLLLSGLIAVAVGVLIATELPSSAVWAIGLLTGINLLSTGVSFVVLALAGRRAGHGQAVPPCVAHESAKPSCVSHVSYAAFRPESAALRGL